MVDRKVQLFSGEIRACRLKMHYVGLSHLNSSSLDLFSIGLHVVKQQAKLK